MNFLSRWCVTRVGQPVSTLRAMTGVTIPWYGRCRFGTGEAYVLLGILQRINDNVMRLAVRPCIPKQVLMVPGCILIHSSKCGMYWSEHFSYDMIPNPKLRLLEITRLCFLSLCRWEVTTTFLDMYVTTSLDIMKWCTKECAIKPESVRMKYIRGKVSAITAPKYGRQRFWGSLKAEPN